MILRQLNKFSLLIIFKACAILLGVLTTRWLNNNLSAEDYSLYNVLIAYNSIILAFIILGIPNLIQKHFTNTHFESLGNLWKTFFYLRILSYFVGLLFILIFVNTGLFDKNVYYFIGVFTIQFILLFDLNFRSICDALGKSWQFSLTDFLGRTLLCIILYTSIKHYFFSSISHLEYFIYASFFTYVVTFTVDYIWQKKHIPKGIFDVAIIKANSKQIFFLSFSGILTSFYMLTDKIFLDRFGVSAFGINSYANAYKIFEVVTILPGILIPPIASSYKKREDLNIHSQFSFKNLIFLNLLLGLTLCIAVIGLGRIGLSLIDPENKYSDSIDVLYILAISLIVYPSILFTSNVLVLKNKESGEFLSTAILVVVALSLYTILIPMYGIVGAAYSTAITFCVDFIAKLLIFKYKK